MKTTTIVLTMLTLTLSSFTSSPSGEVSEKILSSEQLSERILSALQHASAEEYVALFPTVNDFNEVILANAGLYGANLEEAKKDFASTYVRTLVPSVRESFNTVIEEGRKRGINWQAVQLVSVELNDQPKNKFSAVTFAFVFKSAGKEYVLNIDKALVFHGQWKVTQYISLI